MTSHSMDKTPSGANPRMNDEETAAAGAVSFDSGAEEAELVALLASLRVEAAPEADFESRFLYDLRERIAREAVCRPARTLLWEHMTQFWGNLVHRRRLAFGATACGTFALCSAYFALSGGDFSEARVESALTNRFESTLSSLKPGVAKEMTRISVGKPSPIRTAAYSPTSLRPPVLFAEAEDSYESSAYSHPHQQENMTMPQAESLHVPSIGL